MNYQEEKKKKNSYFDGVDISSNYELDIIRDSSDFIEFLKQGKEAYDYNIENGGVLVITDKQYILTMNLGKGQKAHNPTLARVAAAINGYDIRYDFNKLVRLQGQICRQFLHARIYAELTNEKRNFMQLIAFELKPRDRISQKEFQSFMNFYNEYAWIIKREKFRVAFNGVDTTIDELKTFLEQIIDYDLELEENNEERIIGTPTNNIFRK